MRIILSAVTRFCDVKASERAPETFLGNIFVQQWEQRQVAPRSDSIGPHAHYSSREDLSHIEKQGKAALMKQIRGSEKLRIGSGPGRGLGILLLLLLCHQSATSQVEEGEWMLSVFGGPSMMLTDFNKEKFGWAVEYFPQYGVSQHLSIGFLAGYNALKTEQNPPLKTPSYTYLKVTAIPLTVIGSWRFASSQVWSPFVYAGAGMVLALQRDGLGNYISDQHVQAYGLFPLGAGLEFFLRKNLSLGFDVGVRIFGTDSVEGLRRGLPDAYLLGRLGVNIYHLEPD